MAFLRRLCSGARDSRWLTIGFAWLLSGLVSAGVGAGQTSTNFNERDDQYRLLGLKRAKEAHEIARDRYERLRTLNESGVVSAADLDVARQQFSEAEVNFQQSLLAVLFEQQYVAVLGAVKSRGRGGRKKVRLTIENTSGGGAEFRRLVALDDELFESLRPEVVHDVYLSLSNDEGAVISQPYESKIEELRFGSPATLEFDLLQDVDTVTVDMAYGKNAQRSVKVFLQKDSSVDLVAVQSQQFAQEAELGSSATFDLALELFSEVSDTFKLAVVNLPPEINRYFFDPTSQARLSQFRFTGSNRTRGAALRVSLPDRAGGEVVIDQPFPFYVLAIPQDREGEIEVDPSTVMTSAEVAELGVGFARLELVPRGVGALLVRVPQLFHSIASDEGAQLSLELVNDGTKRLDNIEITAETPIGWDKEIRPTILPALAVGEEKKVNLTFSPPSTVVPGKYEVRVQTSSFADDRPIEGEDKTVVVEVRGKPGVTAPLILAMLMVSLVALVVGAGVRLSRR